MHQRFAGAADFRLVSEVQHANPPAGWYPDASGVMRWWDGAAWGTAMPTAGAQSAVTHAAPPQIVLVQPRAPMKEVGIAYLFALLLGGFAAHNFYLRRYGAAIGFLCVWWLGWLTSWLFIGIPLVIAGVIWWVVDLCLLPSFVRTTNERIVREG